MTPHPLIQTCKGWYSHWSLHRRCLCHTELSICLPQKAVLKTISFYRSPQGQEDREGRTVMKEEERNSSFPCSHQWLISLLSPRGWSLGSPDCRGGGLTRSRPEHPGFSLGCPGLLQVSSGSRSAWGNLEIWELNASAITLILPPLWTNFEVDSISELQRKISSLSQVSSLRLCSRVALPIPSGWTMCSDEWSLYFPRSMVIYVLQLKRKKCKYAACVACKVCGRAGGFLSLHYPKLQSLCATEWEDNEVPLEIKWPGEER